MSVLSVENNESFPPKEKPIFTPGPGFTGGFFLRLASGLGWNILFTEGTRSLLGKWASIMEIKNNGSPGYPKMLFLRGEEDGQKWEEKIRRRVEGAKPGENKNLVSPKVTPHHL